MLTLDSALTIEEIFAMLTAISSFLTGAEAIVRATPMFHLAKERVLHATSLLVIALNRLIMSFYPLDVEDVWHATSLKYSEYEDAFQERAFLPDDKEATAYLATLDTLSKIVAAQTKDYPRATAALEYFIMVLRDKLYARIVDPTLPDLFPLTVVGYLDLED